MGKKLILAAVAPVIFALSAGNVGSDEFDEEDLDRWQEQFMQVVDEGRALWTDDEKMIALIAYVRYERRGVELDSVKH